MFLRQIIYRISSLRTIPFHPNIHKLWCTPAMVTAAETTLGGLRLKYTQNKGVKGLRNRKNQYESKEKLNEGDIEELQNDDINNTLNLEDR